MRRPQPAYLLEGERGHRRGVVLGLTMAEIMLLLLFCLLLVSGALLQDRDKKVADAEHRIDELVAAGSVAASSDEVKRVADERAELSRLREERKRLLTLVPASRQPDPRAAIPEETWRELVVAQEIGQAMVDRGVTLTEAVGYAETAKTDLPPAPSGHDWPPIITLGSDEFRFVTNSAELSPEFRRRLETDVAQQVRELLDQYGVDVVEVVGHTDEQPIKSTQQSTLDTMAIPVLNGTAPITALIPVDNAGLGLARAIAVANVLERALGSTSIKIVPLSGAQLVMPGDEVSSGLNPNDDRERRRIELRVRRSDTGEAR